MHVHHPYNPYHPPHHSAHHAHPAHPAHASSPVPPPSTPPNAFASYDFEETPSPNPPSSIIVEMALFALVVVCAIALMFECTSKRCDRLC